MTTAKWTSIQERSRIYAILLQDVTKRGVCRCGGGDALSEQLLDEDVILSTLHPVGLVSSSKCFKCC